MSSNLQSARVTASNAAPAFCQRCRMVVDDGYRRINDLPACDHCFQILATSNHQARIEEIEKSGASDSNLSVAFGLAVMLGGAVLYAAWVIFSGYEMGFFAVGLGWLTGRAMKRGMGRPVTGQLRIVAPASVYASMVLAYAAIGANAVFFTASPEAAKGVTRLMSLMGLGNAPLDGASVAAYALLFPIASGWFAALFLAMGMYEAWKYAGTGDDEPAAAVPDPPKQ